MGGMYAGYVAWKLWGMGGINVAWKLWGMGGMWHGSSGAWEVCGMEALGHEMDR